MHRNAQTLGDAIREFFEDNAELAGEDTGNSCLAGLGRDIGTEWLHSTRVISI